MNLNKGSDPIFRFGALTLGTRGGSASRIGRPQGHAARNVATIRIGVKRAIDYAAVLQTPALAMRRRTKRARLNMRSAHTRVSRPAVIAASRAVPDDPISDA